MIGSSAPGMRVACVDLLRLCLIGAPVFSGCGSPLGPVDHAARTADTIGSWPSPGIEEEAAALEADTLFSETALNLYNEPHRLTITGIGNGGSNFDRSYWIRVTNTNGTVMDTVLTKFSFADSLEPDFLARAGLYALNFDFVRSMSLYFNAFVGVEETCNTQPIDLLLTYAGPKKGRVLYRLAAEDTSNVE